MGMKITFVFAIIGVLCLPFIWLAGCDTMSSQFATRKEAEEIIRKGWLPASLPESAYDIRESHNLDSNRGSGSFRFKPSDAESFKNRLTPTTKAGNATGSGQAMPGVAEVQYYQDGDFYLEIDWERGEGRFWL